MSSKKHHMFKMNCFKFQKFVCTTIRPTQLPYKELFDWDGAAEFVADYLNFVSLDPPHDLVSAHFILFLNIELFKHNYVHFYLFIILL